MGKTMSIFQIKSEKIDWVITFLVSFVFFGNANISVGRTTFNGEKRGRGWPNLENTTSN